jgi:hypothetical protein
VHPLDTEAGAIFPPFRKKVVHVVFARSLVEIADLDSKFGWCDISLVLNRFLLGQPKCKITIKTIIKFAHISI